MAEGSSDAAMVADALFFDRKCKRTAAVTAVFRRTDAGF